MSADEAPTTAVSERELPATMRRIGKASWVRESLDDAVRPKRVVLPAATIATMGTPAAGESADTLGR